MAMAGSAGHRGPVSAIQRMLDSIVFLVLLGVFFPTGLYTVWSVLELRHLPSFRDAPHGALHGTIPAAVGAAGATRAAPTAAAATAAVGVTVTMRDMAFSPRVLEVPAGTTVTWVNEDPYDHAVAYGTPDTPAAERSFEGSGDFGQGGSFSFTFERPGTHEIYCSTPGHYAAGMVMTVVVTEASP